MRDRGLIWDGCANARDLGGLRTTDGRLTRRGAIVRSDQVSRLTAAGWSMLEAHGIRTIVDLRDADERQPDLAHRPPHLETRELPLEDLTDTAFWRQWRRFCCTPLYYRAFLERNQQRVAQIAAAIADAEPGGVLIHCSHGRDRTGLVTLVLLALVGVVPDEIADDYALSADRLRPLFEQLGREDEEVGVQALVRGANTSARAEILATLATLDAATYLRRGGLRDEQVMAIRARLLGGFEQD